MLDGPGFEPATSRSADLRSPDRANQTAEVKKLDPFQFDQTFSNDIQFMVTIETLSAFDYMGNPGLSFKSGF